MPNVAVGIATGVATRGHVSVPPKNGQSTPSGESPAPEALFFTVIMVLIFGITLLLGLYWVARSPYPSYPRVDAEKEKRKAIEAMKDAIFHQALMEDAKARRSVTHFDLDLNDWASNPKKA